MGQTQRPRGCRRTAPHKTRNIGEPTPSTSCRRRESRWHATVVEKPTESTSGLDSSRYCSATRPRAQRTEGIGPSRLPPRRESPLRLGDWKQRSAAQTTRQQSQPSSRKPLASHRWLCHDRPASPAATGDALASLRQQTWTRRGSRSSSTEMVGESVEGLAIMPTQRLAFKRTQNRGRREAARGPRRPHARRITPRSPPPIITQSARNGGRNRARHRRGSSSKSAAQHR